jgi:Uncharacterized conserved protein
MINHIFKTKRTYQEADATDGYRVFVDKFWPRGEKKADFHYDLWAKEIAPSDELRKWFHENPYSHWDEFREKYKQELQHSPALNDFLDKIKGHKTVTLLYSSKDADNNNAVVLQEFLETRI